VDIVESALGSLHAVAAIGAKGMGWRWALASMAALLCGGAFADESRPWDLTLGAGVASMPQYSGASSSHPRVRLWADAEYRTADFGSVALDSGSLTIDPEVRWNVIDRAEAGFGPLIGYRFGRDDKNPGLSSSSDGSSRLRGLPDVDSAVDAGVQGHLRLLGVPVFAQVRSALSGSQGTLFNLGLFLPLFPESALALTVLPTLTWADARQMRALYGVSPSASSASGFAVYAPGAGWENAALELVAEWRVTGSARLVGSVAFERLLDDAASSPIVQSRNQRSVLGGVTWSF
jgi:outer membrane scaffolding protein for murein synthesis (MipA/OmpV family)